MINTISFANVDEKMAHLQSLVNIPSINPKTYDEDVEYFRLDFINHPEFGVGFVEEVLSEKEINVFFSSGPRMIEHKKYLHGKIAN
ncbi:MAG: hypothetical protein CME63_13375 [Halobacteriovoraceae bacterium]|nr:hypothetical protein [Halobacteriovoraceae bacterium]|tara:strand:- start:137 stop:394 length:258 start_codon:yes stop_codon:yes gene_type:complete